MAEALTVVFSSGWTFSGTVILLSIIGICVIATATAINKDE